MIKIFVTGDNHFGTKYDRYPEVKDIIIESRFDAMKNMVRKAEDEGCDLFVVTGDLFNSTKTDTSSVKRAADILSVFPGNVIVLPGNHDYYTGEETVWKDFDKALASRNHNITLIREFRPYHFDADDQKVIIWPAFCQSKYSGSNNLEWIRHEEIQKDGVINIGIAHGAVQGKTPDLKDQYFLMTENELLDIPMDVWLIGHTHVPFPDNLKEDADTAGYRIFNAGTHAQKDLSNHTDGNCFIISVEKTGHVSKVLARKFVSGCVRFHDLAICVKPDNDTALADTVSKAIAGLDKKAVVRLTVSGSARPSEYLEKNRIYRELLGNLLTFEVDDSNLTEEITIEKIRQEYAETSFAAQLMEEFIDNAAELQMIYQLLQDCKEN